MYNNLLFKRGKGVLVIVNPDFEYIDATNIEVYPNHIVYNNNKGQEIILFTDLVKVQSIVINKDIGETVLEG